MSQSPETYMLESFGIGSMFEPFLYNPIQPRRFYNYVPTRRKKFKPSSRQYPNRSLK